MLLTISLLLSFFAGFCVIAAFMPPAFEEERPSLEALGFGSSAGTAKKQSPLKQLAFYNKAFTAGDFGRRLSRDLSVACIKMSPEEFLLMKEGMMVGFALVAFALFPGDNLFLAVLGALVVGHSFPDVWLRGKIKKIKHQIIKELPDVVDLLALCVNAGLDFMLSLKWVVEKSPPSVMVDQMNTVLQEINVGKTRRDALRDLARRYDLPDLSTFSRTLIMADKMGTSMTDALNSLSVDMRYARFRRGEAMALKAPLKLLLPLIFFIFPVVGILVMGPVMLNFFKMDLSTMNISK